MSIMFFFSFCLSLSLSLSLSLFLSISLFSVKFRSDCISAALEYTSCLHPIERATSEECPKAEEMINLTFAPCWSEKTPIDTSQSTWSHPSDSHRRPVASRVWRTTPVIHAYENTYAITYVESDHCDTDRECLLLTTYGFTLSKRIHRVLSRAWDRGVFYDSARIH